MAARVVWCQSEILQCCAAGGVPLDVLSAAVAKAAKKLPTQLEAVENALKQVNAQLQTSCLILHPQICPEGLCRPAVKGTKFPALTHYCECLLLQSESASMCVKPCMWQAQIDTLALCQLWPNACSTLQALGSVLRVMKRNTWGLDMQAGQQGPVFSSQEVGKDNLRRIFRPQVEGLEADSALPKAEFCRLDDCRLRIERLTPQAGQQWPVFGSLEVGKDNLRRIIGPQGSVIKSLEADSGSRLSIDDAGLVHIYSPAREHYRKAVSAIEGITGASLRVGRLFFNFYLISFYSTFIPAAFITDEGQSRTIMLGRRFAM